MRFQFALFVTLDDTPNNRKLSKEEKSIIKNSFLTRYKPKPELLRDEDDSQGWYMPLNNGVPVEAHFEKPRYPTPTEILEIELKAREFFPDSFN